MFTPDELALIAEALDSHMYWQVSEPRQRNDGYVYFDASDENAEELAAIEALVAKVEALQANNPGKSSESSATDSV